MGQRRDYQGSCGNREPKHLSESLPFATVEAIRKQRNQRTSRLDWGRRCRDLVPYVAPCAIIVNLHMHGLRLSACSACKRLRLRCMERVFGSFPTLVRHTMMFPCSVRPAAHSSITNAKSLNCTGNHATETGWDQGIAREYCTPRLLSYTPHPALCSMQGASHKTLDNVPLCIHARCLHACRTMCGG